MASIHAKLIMGFLVLFSSGCVARGHLTYNDPNQPIYSKPALPQASLPKPHIALKVVSYNIQHADRVDKAVELLRSHEALKDADILCLQEMDLPGIQKIADQLGYGYVYYPTVRHIVTDKDFGNAILSRWPLSKSQKHILPLGRMTQMQRIMVSANVHLGDKEIYACCLHDDIYLSAYTKRDMARFVLKTIPDDADYVIVAGDFNTYSQRAQKSVEKEFEEERFIVSTPDVRWTYKHWYFLNKKSKLDHIFSHNMQVVDSGIIFDRTASDHMPIWTKLKLEAPQITYQDPKGRSPMPQPQAKHY